MIESLLVNLNTLLMQHPNLLGAMRFLFWMKSWLLLAVFGVFVMLVYLDRCVYGKDKHFKRKAQGVFLA